MAGASQVSVLLKGNPARLLLVLFGLVGCILVGMLLAPRLRSALSALSAPPLDVSPLVIDLGSIDEGAVKTGRFKLTANGSDAVVVERMLTTCGCTTVGGEVSRTIKPGVPQEAIVRFDSRGRIGPIHQAVHIFLAGQTDNPLEVSIHGNVVEQIQVVPSSVNLGFITRVHPAAFKFNLIRLDGKALRVRNLSHGRDTEVHSTQKSETNVIISGRVCAPTVPGRYEDVVKIETNHIGLRQIRLPIVFEVEPSYVLSPENITVVRPVEGAASTATVVISGPHASALTVSSKPPGTAIQLKPLSNTRMELNLVIPVKGGRGIVTRSKIVLSTPLAEQPRIVLPVFMATH